MSKAGFATNCGADIIFSWPYDTLPTGYEGAVLVTYTPEQQVARTRKAVDQFLAGADFTRPKWPCNYPPNSVIFITALTTRSQSMVIEYLKELGWKEILREPGAHTGGRQEISDSREYEQVFLYNLTPWEKERREKMRKVEPHKVSDEKAACGDYRAHQMGTCACQVKVAVRRSA